jgi:hypothetical protein
MVAELRERRWRRAEAERVLGAWRRSGLSARAFGREHRMDAQRLLWWRKQLNEPAPAREQTALARLIPALVTTVPGIDSDARVAIRFPSGVIIEADSASVSPAWLGALALEIARA